MTAATADLPGGVVHELPQDFAAALHAQPAALAAWRDGLVEGRRDGEGVAVDRQGSIYVGETVTGHLGDTITGHTVKKLVRK